MNALQPQRVAGLALLRLAGRVRTIQADGVPDGSKEVSTGVHLEDVTGATRCLRPRTQLGLVVRRVEDNRRVVSDLGQSLVQFQPGHPSELDVKHQAIELWVLCVREERFGGGISDRLKVVGFQQAP